MNRELTVEEKIDLLLDDMKSFVDYRGISKVNYWINLLVSLDRYEKEISKDVFDWTEEDVVCFFSRNKTYSTMILN